MGFQREITLRWNQSYTQDAPKPDSNFWTKPERDRTAHMYFLDKTKMQNGVKQFSEKNWPCDIHEAIATQESAHLEISGVSHERCRNEPRRPLWWSPAPPTGLRRGEEPRRQSLQHRSRWTDTGFWIGIWSHSQPHTAFLLNSLRIRFLLN